MDTSATSSATMPLLQRRRTIDDGREVPRIATGMKCPEDFRSYSNLDEILASFGNWHPRFRRVVVFSTLIYLVCSLSLATVYHLREILVNEVGHKSSYCCCVNDKHLVHQEATKSILPRLADLNDIVADSDVFNSAATWGYQAGLTMLFVCNRLGRRIVLGVSAILFGVTIGSIYFVAKATVYQVRMTIFFGNVVMTLVDVGLLIHMTEWLPSAARPLGVFFQLSCYHFSEVLATSIIRYSGSFAPNLVLVYSPIVMIAGLSIIMLFKESPYYYLMKQDIDSLQESILYIAEHNKEVTKEMENEVDDAIDDVAFEVFEGNDTVVDAMIRLIKKRQIVVTLVILILTMTAHKEVSSLIDSNALGHFRWGIFEASIRFSIFPMLGLVLGFLITGRRRVLPITLSFATTGLLLVIIYPIRGEDTYDTCTESFVMAGMPGYFILVLTLMAEVVKRSSEIAMTLYALEFFPSAVRPGCLALMHISSSCLSNVVNALSHTLYRLGPGVAKIVPILYCFVVSLMSLLLFKEPFPMRAWYADLDGEKHKERESYPKPLLGKAKPRKTSVVDSDD